MTNNWVAESENSGMDISYWAHELPKMRRGGSSLRENMTLNGRTTTYN